MFFFKMNLQVREILVNISRNNLRESVEKGKHSWLCIRSKSPVDEVNALKRQCQYEITILVPNRIIYVTMIQFLYAGFLLQQKKKREKK